MQVLLHLPDDLAVRFKAAVPPKKRSAFVAELLAKALPEAEDPLYLAALEVERNEALAAEMAQWEACSADGLEPHDAAR